MKFFYGVVARGEMSVCRTEFDFELSESIKRNIRLGHAVFLDKDFVKIKAMAEQIGLLCILYPDEVPSTDKNNPELQKE